MNERLDERTIRLTNGWIHCDQLWRSIASQTEGVTAAHLGLHHLTQPAYLCEIPHCNDAITVL